MNEAAILISLLSLLASLYFNFKKMKKGELEKKEHDSAGMTTVICKLESIGEGVAEIKSEMRAMKIDVGELRDMVIRCEESCKIAHKRIDALAKHLEMEG